MPLFDKCSPITEKMEKIKTIEQLRAHKELLQLQQMITELRMKKEIHELKGRFSLKQILLPSVKRLMMAGVNSGVGKQFLFSTAAKIAKRIFGPGKRSKIQEPRTKK